MAISKVLIGEGRPCALLALVAALFTVGCQSQTQFLDSKQSQAAETALSRGRFEINCPQATSTILSREAVQPVFVGPFLRPEGGQRAEYTVGVAGCGKRTTFVVICPETAEGCFAAGPGQFYRE
jgi:hypothetical protein